MSRKIAEPKEAATSSGPFSCLWKGRISDTCLSRKRQARGITPTLVCDACLCFQFITGRDEYVAEIRTWFPARLLEIRLSLGIKIWTFGHLDWWNSVILIHSLVDPSLAAYFNFAYLKRLMFDEKYINVLELVNNFRKCSRNSGEKRDK